MGTVKAVVARMERSGIRDRRIFGTKAVSSDKEHSRIPLRSSIMRMLFSLWLLYVPATASAGVCRQKHAEEFTAFFSEFSADSYFARSRKIYPLRVLVWEYGVDENGNDSSTPTLSMLSSEDDRKTSSLSSYMKENGLTSRIRELTSTSAVIEVFKDSTDWLETYHFQRKGKCWFMYEFQNHSL